MIVLLIIIGKVLAVALASLVTWALFRTVTKEAKAKRIGWRVVSCNFPIRLFVALAAIGFLAAAAWTATLANSEPLWVPLVFFGFGLACGVFLADLLFTRIEFNDETIVYSTLFGHDLVVSWPEIVRLKYSALAQMYMFETTRNGQKFRAYEFCNGIHEFLAKLELEMAA